MTKKLQKKVGRIKRILSKLRGAVIAFSGGVDSTLLLKLAQAVHEDEVIAVIAASPLHPKEEIEKAQRLAQMLHCRHVVFHSCDLRNKRLVANTKKRCYYCKLHLFRSIQSISRRHGYEILEGSNVSDLKDFRPGLKALSLLGVRSPFIEAGMTKEDIRQCAKAYRLPNWNAPATACLASRIPYGRRLDRKTLKRVEAAERFMRSHGVSRVRVRDHLSVARIEVNPDEFGFVMEYRPKIVRYFNKLGYKYVTLDLTGYTTGSLNR